MNVERILNGSTLTVVVNGKVDTSTAPELEQGIKPYLDGVTDLILDFTGVNYISSAGLRILLSLQKTMSKQGKLKIIGVCDVVAEIFEVTGFCDILTYEKA